MSGKNILIAGIGELGKSLSYDLLLQNNHVIINSRNQEKLKEIVSEYTIYGSIRSFQAMSPIDRYHSTIYP